MANRINVTLTLDTSAFERAVNRTIRNVDRFAARLEGVGRDLTTRLTLPLAGVGVAAVSAFAKFEGLVKGLEAIATEADPAAKQLERLRKIAQNPGISLEQAVAGSIRLQAVGQSAAEAENALLQFSKAVALAGGTAEDLDVVTRQLSQIQSKGRILSEDFLVIAERVPAIGLALETAFGTKNIEAIRESGISATEFVQRLTQGIAQTEAFQKVTGGLANSIDNFKQSLTASLVVLGQEIDATLNLRENLGRLAAIISDAVDAFSSLDSRTKKVIIVTAALTAAVGPLLIAIGALIRTLPLVTTALASFGVTAAAVTGIGVGLALAFSRLSEELGGSEQAISFIQAKFEGLVAIISEVVAIIRDEFSAVFESASLAIEGQFGKAVKRLFQGSELDRDARSLGERLGDAYTNAFEGSLRKSAFRAGLKEGRQEFGGGGGVVAPPVLPPAPSTGEGDKVINRMQKMRELAILNGSAFGALAENIDLSNIKLLQYDSLTSDSTDAMAQAAQAAETWSQSLANGLIPLNAEFAAQQERANELLAAQQERFRGIATFVSSGLQEAFSGFFDTIVSGGQNAFKAFGDVLKKIIAQLAKAAAAALVLSAVFSVFTGGAGAAKGLLGFASGGSLFSGLFKQLTGFASGGLVTGPVTALIGEGPGTTRANPEVVAPLDKLRDILGDTGGAYIATTRISGDDLLILLERAQRNKIR